MVKVIIGKKGTGKTKILVDMVNTAAESATGNVVCIEKGTKLTYDVKHSVRLIDISAYGVSGYAGVLGFVAGILAANYDIKEIFIDGIIKMGGADQNELSDFVAKLEALDSDVDFVLTVSADASEVKENVKNCIVNG